MASVQIKPPTALTSLLFVLSRLLLSTVLSIALIAIAVAAMFATTASEPVSLLVEPFTLLLTPGLLVVVVLAHGHDFLPAHVLYASFVFYFAVFYKALSGRLRSRPGHSSL